MSPLVSLVGLVFEGRAPFRDQYWVPLRTALRRRNRSELVAALRERYDLMTGESARVIADQMLAASVGMRVDGLRSWRAMEAS